jgi:hypothetical protein
MCLLFYGRSTIEATAADIPFHTKLPKLHFKYKKKEKTLVLCAGKQSKPFSGTHGCWFPQTFDI